VFIIVELSCRCKIVSGFSTFEMAGVPLLARDSQGVRLPKGRRGVGSGCTTRLENAHVTEFRELLYPWHPWSGLRIGIHEAIERPGGVVFRCDLTASDANRWLEIPA
jgi:hypothetical protein